ncbi:MAG: hypothetical protein ACI81Y_001378 [Glaciecola sp.]|jgi:hypothetical protein
MVNTLSKIEGSNEIQEKLHLTYHLYESNDRVQILAKGDINSSNR